MRRVKGRTPEASRFGSGSRADDRQAGGSLVAIGRRRTATGPALRQGASGSGDVLPLFLRRLGMSVRRSRRIFLETWTAATGSMTPLDGVRAAPGRDRTLSPASGYGI